MIKLGLATTDLETLYRTRIAPVARARRDSSRIPERTERFDVFLSAALGFLLAGCWPAGRSGPWRWVLSRVDGSLMLASVSLALTATGAGQGENPNAPQRDRGPAAGSSPAVLVARGQSAYESGQLDEALAAFTNASAAAPDQPVPRYDAAATLFALERYEEAFVRYQEARARAGDELRTKIDYALGNTALALRDLPKAIAHYDNCIASTATAQGLDKVREDAAINRRFALEQAASMAIQGESEDDHSAPKPRPRPPGGRQGDREGDTPPDQDPNAEPRSDGSAPPGEAGNRPPRGRRQGGGGGASNDPGALGNSPDDRLDQAIAQARDAQRRRLPEEPPTETPGDSRKDW